MPACWWFGLLAALLLAVTLDDLKQYESPGRKAIAAARKAGKESCQSRRAGCRRIKAEAEKAEGKDG
jgi:hypothetical protein